MAATGIAVPGFFAYSLNLETTTRFATTLQQRTVKLTHWILCRGNYSLLSELRSQQFAHLLYDNSRMSSVDERITYCLEEIDNNFVKAIDIVSSMTRSIKTIASNMREMDSHSRVLCIVWDEPNRRGLLYSTHVKCHRSR